MAAVANFLTCTVTKLELLCNGTSLGTETGFFVKQCDKWSIVTNWHVLSGRDPLTGQPRHSSGGVPDTCRYLTFCLVGENVLVVPQDVCVGDALAGNATWLQHPEHGQNVDLAVIPLTNDQVGAAKDLYDPTGLDEDMLLDLGAELFLPGYPLGFSAPGQLPIWKRASLASSLEFGEGIDQYCFVDTASREGMSGSPCLAVSNWQHYRLDRKNGKVTTVNRPLSWRLIGVYSGRRNPSDGFEAQLGMVWREPLLRTVLDRGVSANVELR